jgi:hypothetical protein
MFVGLYFADRWQPRSSSTGASHCSPVAVSRTRVEEPLSGATMTTVRAFHAATTPGLIGK